MKRISAWVITFFLVQHFSYAQNITPTSDQIKAITSEWKGERFPDGRPKVSDQFLIS